MCDEWYKQKEGLITDSVAHRVLSMQNSLDKGKQRNVSTLVKTITCQKATQNTIAEIPMNSRNWGLKHEKSARQYYYKEELQMFSCIKRVAFINEKALCCWQLR